MIKKLVSNRIAKIIVDILLVAGLFLSILSSRYSADSWGSLHCIASMAWYAVMLVHIWQHWGMTKALFKMKWKILKRNKITFLTFVVFFLMTISVIIFINGVDYKSMTIHHKIAHLFLIVVIIHTIMMAKRFISLFKGRKKMFG